VAKLKIKLETEIKKQRQMEEGIDAMVAREREKLELEKQSTVQKEIMN